MARFRTDFPIQAAARCLAAGDALGALNFVALRDDAPALALRGIAMAQLGDLTHARTLLGKAARSFGVKSAIPRARCILAEAEIALACRELGRSARTLAEARATLEQGGDLLNAAHARLLEVRRLLLIGRVDEAESDLSALRTAALTPAMRASYELIVAGIALRRLRTGPARAAIHRATQSARISGIPGLMEEVGLATRALTDPAARLIGSDGARTLRLDEVEALFDSETLVVDACRNAVRLKDTILLLNRRPVLFALARTLAEAWPGDVPRRVLIQQSFAARTLNESHRARLRVEIGRLRRALGALAGIRATRQGYVLVPRKAPAVAVIGWPHEESHAPVLALLADGECWSSSALATALGASQRTVQRALDSLAAAGRAQSLGRGRSRRWMAPPSPGFTTVLLLPPPFPLD
jgi:hypothetical protein